MKCDPEKTLKGRLALMTEDRDHFQFALKQVQDELRDAKAESKAKDNYIAGYKHKVQFQLDWYRIHIQALVSKIPGGGR